MLSPHLTFSFKVFFQHTAPAKAYHSVWPVGKASSLNLVIPLDSLLVTWWYPLVSSRGAPLLWHRCRCRGRSRGRCRCSGTVCTCTVRSPIPFRRGRFRLRLRPSLLLLLIDLIIISSNPAGASLTTVVGNLFVRIVGLLRIGGDDVPGMDETGEETKNAQGDIYEGVNRAKATFDPD